jgi:hypothetical protein
MEGDEMRDLSKPIDVTLGDETLTLRLDMTALADFEDAAGMSVPEFVRPVLPVLGDLQAEATRADGAVDPNAAGLRMLDDLLAVDTLSARNLLYLAWALAGGEDRDETPREFGRRVNVGTGRDLLEGVMAAIREGMPEADEDAEDEESADTDEADADPTPSPQ